MCLAIPGRVDEVFEENGLRMGKVNFGGIVKRVCLDFVPEISVSDCAIVHVGFAIERVDQETAERTLEVFRKMGVLEEAFFCSRARENELPGWELCGGSRKGYGLKFVGSHPFRMERRMDGALQDFWLRFVESQV
jgi:hydrogenase expression/formation protein HypC